VARARSAAVALVYRSIIIRDFQPATSINSFSLPPSASQLVAKACRSWWGMHSRKPRGPGPVVHDLVDARGSHGSIAPHPEVRQVRKSMLLAYPQIAVQGLGGLAAKRERPRSVTLAEYLHHPLIQVDVVNSHADALGAAHAGINEQQDDGGVTPAGEVPALTGLEKADELLCSDDTDGLLGEVGRLHAVHGAGLKVALGDRPLEERVETPVAVVGGRRLPASELVGDEVLDMLAS
jgi:hypothetical protein